MPAERGAEAGGSEWAPGLLAVVLNYRTAELTLACVRSLVTQMRAGSDAIVVVDNASGDGSSEEIRAAIAREGWGECVRLVASDRNGGFAYGMNRGIEAADASAYLLCNSDLEVAPGAVAELRRAAAEHPEVGIFGPSIEARDGSLRASAFRARTPLGELLEAAALGPLSRLFERYEVVLPVTREVCRPGWLSFACVLVRAEVATALGGLDEDYFMYFEDVDFCRRAGQAGWQLLYCPGARVVHDEGGSSGVQARLEALERPPGYYYDSRARYFAKFFGVAGLWLANALREAGLGLAWLRRVVGAGGRRPCAREWIDVWRSSRQPIRSVGFDGPEGPST